MPPSPENSATPSSSEELRRALFSIETNLKTTGSEFLVFGFFTLMMLSGLVHTLAFDGGKELIASRWVRLTLGFAFILSLVQITTGIGLRRLRPWARLTGIGLSFVYLLIIPFGTIFGAIFLRALLGRRSRQVCSQRYWTAIHETPHLIDRRPRRQGLLLVIALIFLTIAAFFAFNA